MSIDVDKFGAAVAKIIKAHVASETALLNARLKAAEAALASVLRRVDAFEAKAGKPRVRVSAGDWQRPLEGQA